MADEDDVIFVLVIKKKEEDTEKVKREEEKQEDTEKEKRKVKREEGKEEDLKENENEEEEAAAAAFHELPETEKLNVVQATKRNVDFLRIIRYEACKANKRVDILTFNQVKEVVENQMEYPREISFLLADKIFSSEIQRVLKIPELKFIPCIIWNDGKTKKGRAWWAHKIRQVIVGIWSEKYATMRREATKPDDALSTTEKTSSEEEEEEPDDGVSEEEEEPDDGESDEEEEEEEEEEEPDDGESDDGEGK